MSPKPPADGLQITRKPRPARRKPRPASVPEDAPTRGAASSRRPLTHTRGAERHDGDPRRADQLARAFRVSVADRDLPVSGVHGVHPYPARFHPAWARAILADLQPDAVVFDPFCGSGSVLVEASLSGRRSFGSDVNGVAVRIASLRTTRRDEYFLESVSRSARNVFDRSGERRDSPFGALAKGNKAFAPHVLTQLISLRDAIEYVRDDEVREVLLLCMTPLLGKFGSKPNKKAPEVSRRAVRDHFFSRVERTVMALADHANMLDDHLPNPEIREADARKMPWDTASADAVITSPPYPGVYHYALEQRLTAQWLAHAGLTKDLLKRAWTQEMGRRGTRPGSWLGAMAPVLREIGRVVRPGGRIFLVLGDGVEMDTPVHIDDAMGGLLREGSLPLRFVAAVSQERPHFHEPTVELFEGRPRREHLVELERLR